MLMVHCNTFVPTAIAVIPLTFNVGVVIVTKPETTVQLPVPTPGKFPLSVAVGEHTVWFAPALDKVGLVSLKISTVEVDGGQTPLLIVHWKILELNPNPVTPLVSNVGVVTTPAPEIKLHKPVPMVGVLAVIVAVVAQTV